MLRIHHSFQALLCRRLECNAVQQNVEGGGARDLTEQDWVGDISKLEVRKNEEQRRLKDI
jgi:hypothetical protein